MCLTLPPVLCIDPNVVTVQNVPTVSEADLTVTCLHVSASTVDY